jgi:hypothetical protein
MRKLRLEERGKGMKQFLMFPIHVLTTLFLLFIRLLALIPLLTGALIAWFLFWGVEGFYRAMSILDPEIGE